MFRFEVSISVRFFRQFACNIQSVLYSGLFKCWIRFSVAVSSKTNPSKPVFKATFITRVVTIINSFHIDNLNLLYYRFREKTIHSPLFKRFLQLFSHCIISHFSSKWIINAFSKILKQNLNHRPFSGFAEATLWNKQLEMFPCLVKF